MFVSVVLQADGGVAEVVEWTVRDLTRPEEGPD
jgi:hypothetical protein